MKFVHIADFHFDSAFANLSEKEGLGEKCRLKQMKVLKNIIEYIKENQIENLFISGDLYEQKYIKESTIKNINNLFSEIPQTKIYIAPGNHDPYIKNSYYNRFKWSENVKIFSGKIEKVETPEADIYGFGFDDFYCKSSGLENFEIENKNKINILIMHADLDATANTPKPYNPVATKLLQSKGFNYIALGHIHKPAQISTQSANFAVLTSTSENLPPSENSVSSQIIVYPGSTFPQGFDELGPRGMVIGEITLDSIHTEFVPLNEITFEEAEIDVTNIDTKEELIEKINTVSAKNRKRETAIVDFYQCGRQNNNLKKINSGEVTNFNKNNANRQAQLRNRQIRFIQTHRKRKRYKNKRHHRTKLRFRCA